MVPLASSDTAPGARARAVLAARLCARRDEIEESVLARVLSLSGPAQEIEAEYARGLRLAVSAAVEHALVTVEVGEERVPPAPPELLAQARRAANAGVSLDTVLRRYFAGHALIADFLVEEAAGEGGLKGGKLQRLLLSQASVVDRITAEVSAEHVREVERLHRSTARRRSELVERLLAGEHLDADELGYDLDAHHLGAIAKGPGAQKALAELGRSLDRRLLVVPHGGEDAVWAWLGGREPLESRDIERLLAANWPPRVRLALGEPAEAPRGWRLTHQQARAALPIALRSPEPFVRYADVALLATILSDDLLATSLRELYLKPLEDDRGRGEVLRETLRAYFATGRNVSSAAAKLGVRRHTVTGRLRVVEEQLDRPLESCATELDVALDLERLTDLAHSES